MHWYLQPSIRLNFLDNTFQRVRIDIDSLDLGMHNAGLRHNICTVDFYNRLTGITVTGWLDDEPWANWIRDFKL